MNKLEGVTPRRALIGLAALIVVGGIALALVSSSPFGLSGGDFAGPALTPNGYRSNALTSVDGSVSNLVSKGFFVQPQGSSYVGPGNTRVVGQVSTITMTATSTVSRHPGNVVPTPAAANVTRGTPTGAGGLIEFSSDLALRSASPAQTSSGVVALAYSAGGYVAYQSTYSNSAYVVIRIPSSQYQQVLTKVEGMGTVLSLVSNSNDVRVQYTDLNATLVSLRTEQAALLKLLNQSTTVNSTLAIETQLQQVNQQINEVESQILQTKTLIDYATINVMITETAQSVPLSLSLSVSASNGTAPLSVTFNAIVKGGAQPYIVNYNFGDGYASEGQIVIHSYFQSGDYKVYVSATDYNGTVVHASTTVKVEAASGQSGIQSFFGNVANLFVSVVEGIVEVSVVVLPIAALGAAIIVPIQRHGKNQKAIKQSQ